jgi:hypothetical protein
MKYPGPCACRALFSCYNQKTIAQYSPDALSEDRGIRPIMFSR